jgi:hypothetical protein
MTRDGDVRFESRRARENWNAVHRAAVWRENGRGSVTELSLFLEEEEAGRGACTRFAHRYRYIYIYMCVCKLEGSLEIPFGRTYG